MELIFCTHNENKVIEINKLLPDEFQLIGLSDLGFSDEIEETGSTLEENALIKVRTIYNSYKKIVLQMIQDSKLMHWKESPGFTLPDMQEIKKMQMTTSPDYLKKWKKSMIARLALEQWSL